MIKGNAFAQVIKHLVLRQALSLCEKSSMTMDLVMLLATMLSGSEVSCRALTAIVARLISSSKSIIPMICPCRVVLGTPEASGLSCLIQLLAGKTAYAVAANKAVRDAFRRYMAEAPEQWDWAAANVPSALTPEMDQQHHSKEVREMWRVSERTQITLAFSESCLISSPRSSHQAAGR